MKVLVAVAVILFIGLVRGEQKCHKDSHGIRRFHGKPCASTTRYNDGHRGACGCGPSNSDTPFDWNLSEYVTAPNQMYFDDGGMNTWCARNCGKCVKLTPTGGFVPQKGDRPRNMNPIVFMVTNDCPIGDNFEWCGQSGKPGTNHPNTHGYEAHFDLQNNRNQILGGLGWNNPEVTWEQIECPHHLKTKYSQCECH